MRIGSRRLVQFLLVVCLVGCNAPAPTGDRSPEGETPPRAVEESPVDTPSGEQRSAGWQPLFDGESLRGWRGFGMESVPAGWGVEEGVLHFAPAEGERSDLITEEEFADFELALEWKVSPGGNSGIMFRVSEDHERSYQTGPEMQILDDERHRDGQSPLTSAGSNYALHPPTEDVVRPAGEWNEVRLVVDGDRVEHWMNGTKIVEYRLWDEDWKKRVAKSKFASMPGYGLNESGHIALQDHGDEIWFRDIRIRRFGEEP